MGLLNIEGAFDRVILWREIIEECGTEKSIYLSSLLK
jgi:hypothetical protein